MSQKIFQRKKPYSKNFANGSKMSSKSIGKLPFILNKVNVLYYYLYNFFSRFLLIWRKLYFPQIILSGYSYLLDMVKDLMILIQITLSQGGLAVLLQNSLPYISTVSSTITQLHYYLISITYKNNILAISDCFSTFDFYSYSLYSCYSATFTIQ